MLRPRQGVEPIEIGDLVIETGETTRADLKVVPRPTWGRTIIKIAPQIMPDLVAAYDRDLAPLLHQQFGPEVERQVADSVFTTRFAMPLAHQFHQRHRAIFQPNPLDDPLFEQWRDDWGRDSRLWVRVGLHTAPAGLGKTVALGPGTTRPTGAGTVRKVHGRQVPAGPGSHRGVFHSFDVTDGLASNTVYAMLQDRQGDLWFGTEGGLCRYDGVTFTTYTARDGLVYDWVYALLEDRDGDLWVGTGAAKFGPGGALVRFDGTNFTAFTEADGLPASPVMALLQDQRGDLWFGTHGGGLCRYDGTHLTTFTTQDGLPTNHISFHGLIEDEEGHLWFGNYSNNPTGGRGLTRLAGRALTQFTTEDGLSRNRLWSLLADRRGRLWLGTEGGVVRFDGREMTHYGLPDGLISPTCLSSLEDRQGQLWFGTTGGLSRFDGRTFLRFTARDGLPHSYHMSCLLEDREGNLWVGTGYFGTGAGISRYTGAFTTFTTADGLPHDRVLTIHSDPQGDLWIGTKGGLSRFDGQTFTNFTTEDGLAFDKVAALLPEPDGHLWLGHGLWVGFVQGGVGLSRYDGTQFTTFSRADADGLPSRWVGALLKDRRDYLWIGTGDGLGRYDGTQFHAYYTDDGLSDNQIQTLLEDRQGDLWIGTFAGLNRYDGDQFHSFSIQDGLPHDQIRALLQDRQGDLWIGTENGLSRYDGAQFHNFSTQDGLGGNTVNALLEDPDGRLWIATQGGGLTQYDGLVFQTLLQQDGLAADRVHTLHQDGNGDLWIGTEKGLSRYRPHPIPPLVRLTGVTADRAYGAVDSLALPTTQGRVRFEFSGHSYKTRPGQVAYAYRLAGLEENWRWTRDRSVEYTDLAEGSYQFQVQAVDRDLTYSTEPATVDLDVYYQPLVSPVRLANIQLEDLFASFYKTYAHQPVGTVDLINDGPDSARVTLSFTIPELMPRRSEQDLVLAPRSTRAAPLYAALDHQALAVQDRLDTQAEIALSFTAGDEVISVQKKATLTLYGRGALTWDRVDRAAAFVTSTDPAVVQFTRPVLHAFEAEVDGQGIPTRNLTRALILFEALKQHGLRYAADPNTPYSRVQTDRAAVDHIQYPAQTLQSQSGDCDDLTVLYCALLESAGVATALVDYPNHLFMLFDTGIERGQAYRLPLDSRRYVVRRDRLWLPVEITAIDQGFDQAWTQGLEELTKLSGRDLHRRVVDLSLAWEAFPPPPALPVTTAIAPPERADFEPAFVAQYDHLEDAIDTHIQETYLGPLKTDPSNDGLRAQLLQVYLALRRYDIALKTAFDALLEDQGDKAALHNHLGITYLLKAEASQAAYHFKQALALALAPQDRGIQKNLDLALASLGKGSGTQLAARLAAAGSDSTKSGRLDLDIEQFYWME